jgi:hypothetical protein
MKKIFFIIGIAIFSFASAQQNDFLDVQKIIHKKYEAKKKLITDSLYIRYRFCWYPTDHLCFKSGLKIIPDKVKGDILRKLTTTDTPYYFPKVITFQLPRAKLLYTLPNGNKVYSLPQDNMPCVVPDMSQYNSMALVKPDMQQYNIPNPAYPPQNKVVPITPEKLKELQELLDKRSKNTN